MPIPIFSIVCFFTLPFTSLFNYNSLLSIAMSYVTFFDVFNFDEKLQIPQRLLGLLESLKGVNIGNLIDLFEHSIQTATR